MGFSIDIIPVVFGGCNYSQFAPPHSFIDVADYKDPEELADYLKYLSENPDEYIKYFWWKEHYVLHRSRETFCDLCQQLHSPILKNQVKYYKDIKE